MWLNIQRNWKTNLVSLVAFVYTVPQAVLCIKAWMNHQPCNWREAVVGLLLTAAAAFAKDSTNHSTQTEVTKSTIEVKAEQPIVWEHPKETK